MKPTLVPLAVPWVPVMNVHVYPVIYYNRNDCILVSDPSSARAITLNGVAPAFTMLPIIQTSQISLLHLNKPGPQTV